MREVTAAGSVEQKVSNNYLVFSRNKKIIIQSCLKMNRMLLNMVFVRYDEVLFLFRFDYVSLN